MFKSKNFCHIASNNRNTVKVGVFVYRTTDDLDTVTASGYFNERIIDINLHDLIIHEQIDATDNTKVTRNVLCVTERTLDNVIATPVLNEWEDEIEQAIEDLQNNKLNIVDLPTEKFAINESDTLRNLTERFNDVINVKDFGAKGDGITDDTAAIQAALNKCGNVYIPEGNYNVADALFVYSNTNLELNPKAKILFTGTYGNHSGIHVEGSVDSAWYHLTADAGRGAKEIELDSTSGLSVGDTILICDDRSSGTDIVDGQTVSVRTKSGEMHKIKSISGNTVTIDDTIFVESYATARNAFVKKLNTLENIRIAGGEISGLDTDASGGHFQNRGIKVYCVNNFKIENIKVKKFRLEGIIAELSNNGIIDGCSFEYIFDVDLGYAIMNAGSQNITTRSCDATLCGKLWDTGGGSWVENNTTYDYGWTRFVTCRDSKATSCTRAAIGTHEPTDYALIDNNAISLDDSIEYNAILVRSNNTNITNNSVVYCGRSANNSLLQGISVYTKGFNGNVVVSGNKIIDTNGHNIAVYICENWYRLDVPTSDISTYKPTKVIIENNYIESQSTKADAQMNMIYVCGMRVDGDGSVSIKNNMIRMTNNRKAGIFVSGKLEDLSISDNIIYSKRPIYIVGDSNAKTTVIKNMNISNNTITVLNGSAFEIVPTQSPDYTATVNIGAIFGNLVYTTYNSLGTFATNIPDDFLWLNSYVFPNLTKGTVGNLADIVSLTKDQSIGGTKTFSLAAFGVPSDADNSILTTIKKYQTGGSGYIKFGNGLIIQWGNLGAGSDGTITFFTPFTTNNYSVSLTGLYSTSAVSCTIENPTTTTCDYHCSRNDVGIRYVAIGY